MWAHMWRGAACVCTGMALTADDVHHALFKALQLLLCIRREVNDRSPTPVSARLLLTATAYAPGVQRPVLIAQQRLEVRMLPQVPRADACGIEGLCSRTRQANELERCVLSVLLAQMMGDG